MIEKTFGTMYGPPLDRNAKAACIVHLQAEIDRLGGVPYGWMGVYEALLFGFYNRHTGQCFPSHQAIAQKARCSVATVKRALKWAKDNALISWAHGVVQHGWRLLRTSNRYAFAAFLTMRRMVPSFVVTDAQRERRYLTSYKSLAHTAAEARTFRFPPAPCTLRTQKSSTPG